MIPSTLQKSFCAAPLQGKRTCWLPVIRLTCPISCGCYHSDRHHSWSCEYMYCLIPVGGAHEHSSSTSEHALLLSDRPWPLLLHQTDTTPSHSAPLSDAGSRSMTSPQNPKNSLHIKQESMVCFHIYKYTFKWSTL